MDLNTCFETTQDYRVVAYYSHLVPLFITIIVSFFVLSKSRYSLLSKVFAFFSAGFGLWLLGDVFAWTANDYDFVSFVWAPLDYINIIFYLLGAYFFYVLITGKDFNFLQKFFLIGVTIPAWWITIKGQSITEFYQPACEAFNNEFLSDYKFVVELGVIAFIMFFALIKGRKSAQEKRIQIITVSLALILFFSFFSSTEFLSSTTGIYEINLYSLFILPVFLFIIIYSIINLKVFKARLIGFQLLAYVLIIMVGSQFFFLQNATNRALSLITFILSLGFGALLVRSGKRELEARQKIERLVSDLEKANNELKENDRQKDELLSIVSHQLATPVSSMKWYTEMLMEGDIGKITKQQKEHLTSMMEVSMNLSDLVSMILDVSRIQLGRMHIEKQKLDLKQFFKEILEVIEPKAIEKKIKFEKVMPKNLPEAMLDRRYTRMTIENLLSNAIKYTPATGKVMFKIEIKNNILYCEVKDTGIGIPKADQEKIFGRMFRASNVRNAVDGNGFGLYIAKGAIEAQGGKIWFESTEGKGTTFFVELPLK